MLFVMNHKQERRIVLFDQLLKVMKLTTLLLLTTLSLTAKVGLSQKVSLRMENVYLSQVFKELRKQSGILFLFDNEEARKVGKVSVNVQNVSVEDAMNTVLRNTGYTFTIIDKTIVMSPEKHHSAPVLADNPPPVDVKGMVKDEKGAPLAGVAVMVKGKSGKGVVTQENGSFLLKNVELGDVLEFSMLGYKHQSVKVTEANKNSISVSLTIQAGDLNAVVVTGFQNIEKKKFTGATTKLSADEVKVDGFSDVSRMLEGRAAGVSVQNVSGTFGAAPKVRVRGATSISGDNKPLWVVDGIPLEDVINISNDQLSSGDANTLLGSSVAGINVDDIESFDILKDASATALYGARAMNGVIVITTKKGKSGKPQISYTGNFSSMLKPSYGDFNIMNSADQMSVYDELDRKGYLINSRLAASANGGVYNKMYKLINLYDSSAGAFGLQNTPEARQAFLSRYALANTDWFDVLFKNSLSQEHSLNISSGNDLSQFYFSTSYFGDNGWALGNNTKRYTINMRGNYKVGKKLTLGFITTGSIREQKAPGTNDRVDDVVSGSYERGFDINPYSYALNTSRTITPYDQNGKLEYFTRNYAPFNILNELENNTIDINVLDLKMQGELGFKINKHFTFNAVGNLRYVRTGQEQRVTEYSNVARAYRANDPAFIDDNRYLYVPPDRPNNIPISVLPEGGFYNRVENTLKSFSIRNNLTYNQMFGGRHNVNVLVGQEIRYADRQNSFNKGFGYLYDGGGIAVTDYQIIKDLLEQGSAYYGMGLKHDRFVAFMGNANYAFSNKYIFNATVRYDGSNQLGGSRQARWLPTWTLGGAWNVDAEKFMANAEKINYLKLRASYGLTASMPNATNSSIVLSTGTTLRTNLSDKETQINISSLENSELTWEKQYTANLGVDIGMLDDKINVSVDVYKRNSFDLISTLKTAGIGGQAYKIANYADMDSKGIEVTFGTRLIKTRDWKWSTNLTFAYNENTITNLKNIPRIYDLVIPEGGALEGGPVRGLYSIQFAGLDPFSGMPGFIDESGKTSLDVYLQSNSTQYLKYEGSVDPKINGGFLNTVNYKDFTFSFLVTYQLGSKVRMSPVFRPRYADVDALPREFVNRWTVPGDEKFTNIPSIISQYENFQLSSSYPYNNYNYSDVRVADGSFVRLKTISVAYNLRPGIAAKFGAKGASLSLLANNIWLIYADKKLQGQDPEFFTSGGVALPMPRQLTASLKLNF